MNYQTSIQFYYMKTKKKTKPKTGITPFVNSYHPRRHGWVSRYLESLKRDVAVTADNMPPAYEAFAVHELWLNVRSGRWPQLSATSLPESSGPGALIRDWTKEYVILGSRFDMGPFEVFAGLRIYRQGIHQRMTELHDEVFLGLFSEDEQCVAGVLNDESMEYLSMFFRRFAPSHHLDFEGDPFLYCEVPHMDGLATFTCLLDHLQTIFTTNSPEILCADIFSE